MSTTMRGVQLRGARDAVTLNVPMPTPGPGELVLRVDAALTCGTDAKVYRRGYHARMLTPPCLIGHEYTGTVTEVGEGVLGFAPGDAVVGANSAPCGTCSYCAAGREALCDDLLFVNGAFAEFLLIEERVVRTNLYPRPRGLDPVHAAATEPVACVLKGVEIAAPRPGEDVLVLGSGPVALVFAAELAALGVPCDVFVRHAEGQRAAESMGARRAVRAHRLHEALEELVAGTAHGRGYDLVIEAAGAEETTGVAPELCRRGGRVLLFGGCGPEARVTWAPARLHYDEITILSSFHHTPRHVRAALDAIASGRIRVGALLERAVGLDDVPRALEDMVERRLRGKVPVIPGTRRESPPHPAVL